MNYEIGFVDIDPDTGFESPFVRICETDEKYMCLWTMGALKRNLMDVADQPNREIRVRQVICEQVNKVEKEWIIGFHKWMLKNDTEENAEKYFHYSDEDMVNEYIQENLSKD